MIYWYNHIVLARLRNSRYWPVALLLLLPFTLFGPALLPGRVLSPADLLGLYYPWRAVLPTHTPGNPLLADQALQFHPWLLHAAREIREGRLPLWNPHAYTGAPFLANVQSALFSPFTVLAYFLPVPFALGLAAIGKLAVAGLSTYWFLRLIGLGLFGSMVGAVTFMFNGFLMVWLGHPHSAVAVWLPALFATTEWLRQTGSRWAMGSLAGTVFLQFLGGHPETSLHLLAAFGLYALYRLWGPRAGQFALQFGIACLAGTLLAAIQLLPFFEYLQRSSALFYRLQWGPPLLVPSWAWIAWLVPRYFGSPIHGNYWGLWNYNEITGYVGIIPLVLLPCAALGGGMRKSVGPFFWGLLFLTPLAVYDTTRAPFWLARLPGFSVSANHRLILVLGACRRNDPTSISTGSKRIGEAEIFEPEPNAPSRFRSHAVETHYSDRLLAFAAAVLAGLGVDRLQGLTGPSRRVALVVKAFFAAALLAVGWQLWVDLPELLSRSLLVTVSQELLLFLGILTGGALLVLRALGRGLTTSLSLGLMALALLDLLRMASSYNPVIDRRIFYPSTPALEFIRKNPEIFRVLLPLPNLGAVYGLSDITGYDAMTPRSIEQLVDSTQSVGPFGNASLSFTEGMESPILDLLTVKYVLRPPGEALSGQKFMPVYEGPDGRIYQNLRVFPRAFIAAETIACLDDALALALVKGGTLNLRRQVVVHTCDSLPPPLQGPTGAATVLHYTAGVVRVRFDSPQPAVLVLADSYDPGWRVTVDGERRPLYRANYALRAVVVPAGIHEIEFSYRPWSVLVGAGITGATAILLGVFLIFGAAGARIAIALLLALAATAGTGAAHTPPPLPANLSLETRDPTAGGLIRANVILRGDPAPPLPDARADLYVALIAPRRMLFLDQGGGWRPWPIPHRRAYPMGQIAGLRIVGPVDRPMTGAGFHTLAVGFVQPGKNPLIPDHWVASPLTTPVAVARAWSLTPADRMWLGVLAAAALTALFLVLLA